MRIFIIGFMGAGKTHLGKKIIYQTGLPFYDIDEEIEKNTSLTIQEIFKIYGEKYFRKVESETLINWDKDGIIVTGGGIVELLKNRDFLKKNKAKIIWLNTSWEIIRNRILNSDRPLVKKLSEQEIFELWEKRSHLYNECADNVYNENEIETLVDEINKLIEKK